MDDPINPIFLAEIRERVNAAIIKVAETGIVPEGDELAATVADGYFDTLSAEDRLIISKTEIARIARNYLAEFADDLGDIDWEPDQRQH